MKKNVLLFEKHENLRRLHEAMLSKDFRVSTASTPHEVVAWVKIGEIPNAIVASIRSDGSEEANELLQLYRNFGIVARIPLFLVETGQVDNFMAELNETPIHKVEKASKLLVALQDFFLKPEPRLQGEGRLPSVSEQINLHTAWS
jgi:DNA-binding NtrC family response regulator